VSIKFRSPRAGHVDWNVMSAHLHNKHGNASANSKQKGFRREFHARLAAVAKEYKSLSMTKRLPRSNSLLQAACSSVATCSKRSDCCHVQGARHEVCSASRHAPQSHCQPTHHDHNASQTHSTVQLDTVRDVALLFEAGAGFGYWAWTATCSAMPSPNSSGKMECRLR
jgi:hypothetical protein